MNIACGCTNAAPKSHGMVTGRMGNVLATVVFKVFGRSNTARQIGNVNLAGNKGILNARL